MALEHCRSTQLGFYSNRSLRFTLQILVSNDMPDREKLFYIFILLPNMGAVKVRMRMAHEMTVNLSSRIEPDA